MEASRFSVRQPEKTADQGNRIKMAWM